MKTSFDVNALGKAIGIALANQESNIRNGVRTKETSLTLSGGGSIYGRNSIFDPCEAGDIFGMQVQTTGLVNWLGWRPNGFYRRRVSFIPWYGPEGLKAGGIATTSGAGAPCDDPHGWEFGVCGYDLTHTSWYHRAGEALDPHTIVQTRCETSPRYRLNGVQISDDVEWQMQGVMNTLQMDIRRDVVHGSHLNAHQMDGLESLVRTSWLNDDGTSCPQIASTLIDWNKDNLNGENNNLGNFFDYLDEVVTEIEWRASNLGGIMETDMVLYTSRFMATCLLDSYSCYTTCGVTTIGDVSDQALRAAARQARFDLNGGPLYDGTSAVGFIRLKSGRRLPIMVDDTFDIAKPNANFTSDIYLLTRRVGSMDVLYGEYLDMRVYENRARAQMPMFTARADAAGRFVTKGVEDNWCIKLIMGSSPEIFLSAPWAQARFENVGCARKRVPLTGDVFQPSYLPGGAPLHTAHIDV